MDNHRSQGYDGLQTVPLAGLEHDNGSEALERVQPEEDYPTKTMEGTAVDLGQQRPGKDPWKRRAIWIAIVLGTLLVISAVAGGVAGSIAVRNARNSISSSPAPSCPATIIQNLITSPSNTSINSTSTNGTNSGTISYTLDQAGLAQNLSVPIPTMVDTVALDCPSLDMRVYTTLLGAVFTIQCGLDIYGGDIVGIIVYSLYDCINACSSMNSFNETECKAVTFSSIMANAVNVNHANCWLKDNTNHTFSKPGDAIARPLG